jgi:RNA 2',3'-cyclic 3'-phosphodiesterase
LSEQRIRLFVAVSVPPEQLAALERAIEPLKETVSGARWAPISNLHITLKFLGWTDVGMVDAVRAVIREAAANQNPASLALAEGLGAFPSVRRARVVWAGIDDSEMLLTKMAGELDEGFSALGFEPESRTYTPHLTVARLKTPRPVSLDDVSIAAERWVAQDVELFRSHLSPKGARYESLLSERLGG